MMPMSDATLLATAAGQGKRPPARLLTLIPLEPRGGGRHVHGDGARLVRLTLLLRSGLAPSRPVPAPTLHSHIAPGPLPPPS